MTRRVLCVSALLSIGLGALTACDDTTGSGSQESQSADECEASEDWVQDVCVELAPDDGCAEVGDRCIRHCTVDDECSGSAGELCPLDPWPVAPDGFCVIQEPEAVADCEADEAWVEDVCVELAPDDGCAETGDRCIRLCTSDDDCSGNAGDLCPVAPWPVAPDGYCVIDS